MSVGAGAGSGAGAGGREDAMDASVALLMLLMERMDTSDAWQAAMGKALQAFHTAAPAGSACVAVACCRGT